MEPISLALIQAGRDLTEPRLTPDAWAVSFVHRWRGAAAINIVPIDGGPERPLSIGPDPSPGRGWVGGCYTHLRRDASLVYAATDGELWWQRGADCQPLTSLGRHTRGPAVAEAGRNDEQFVAFVVDEAEVWVVDLDDLSARRIDHTEHAFCFDVAVSPDEKVVSWQGWNPPDMPWDGAVRVDVDLVTGEMRTWKVDGAIQQPRFTPDGRLAHVHDASGWLNVYVGDHSIVSESVEHAGPTWGMGARSFAFDPRGGRLAFTRNEMGHGALCVTDLATGAIEQIGRGVHGQLHWVGDYLVALRSGARTPTQVVTYRDAMPQRSIIAMSQAAGWSTEELPEPEIVSARNADGVELHARRFSAGKGRMLCWVHGGPTDQWQVEWRPRIAYWWSRGWDVLVVDPRGTTGHGREYQQALHGNWGRIDTDDTADLVRHAHRFGWAAPDTTVMMGGSSGGLTVLAMLADYPDLVAGGVASYPVSDLRALTEVTHRFEAHYTDTLVAKNDDSEASNAAFAAQSPLMRAEQITAPLLVFHGTDDPVVPIEQSNLLVERVGSDAVTYVVFEGEGHGFRDPQNVLEEYAETEAFLDRILG